MALDTNPTIYVARNPLAGWVLTDDTHIYGAYRTLRAAKADLRLLQAGGLVAKVTDEGKGFLVPAPKVRVYRYHGGTWSQVPGLGQADGISRQEADAWVAAHDDGQEYKLIEVRS